MVSILIYNIVRRCQGLSCISSIKRIMLCRRSSCILINLFMMTSSGRRLRITWRLSPSTPSHYTQCDWHVRPTLWSCIFQSDASENLTMCIPYPDLPFRLIPTPFFVGSSMVSSRIGRIICFHMSA
ncbi:unnamed protein product [Vicia faba]|uniref:Uncharacterized protein n=1 Tax=Vicia faba TaxID=3906 RepID=A0AAV0ZD29_VICFA|nr:unnamed protein product [Vicia faba]